MDVTGLLGQVEIGGYISPWKVGFFLVVVLGWARALTWIDKDAKHVRLPREMINIGLLGGLIVSVIIFFLIPGFAIAFPIFSFLCLADIGVYLLIRNQKAGLKDLGKQLKGSFDSVKPSQKKEEAASDLVQFLGSAGNILPSPAPETPEFPIFQAVQALLADPLRRRAERVELMPAEGAYESRFIVDGFLYSGGGVERGTAAATIGHLKKLANLDLNERRKPQVGQLKVVIDGTKHTLSVQTAGSTAGELVRVVVDADTRHSFKLDNLGFTEDQLALVQQSLSESGVVLLTAPKDQGLTALQYAALRAHDAFLSHIHTVERLPSQDLEGITQNTVAPGAPPGEELKQMEWVVSQEPDVLLVSRVEDPRSAIALARYAATGRKAYLGLRSASVFDALADWRKLIGDDRLAMEHLRLIITGRILRKLCPACKVGYAPDPQTLRKLNMDPNRISKLYQERKEPLRDAKGNVVPCDFCKEMRFVGRMGVYEVFQIDDEVRKIVLSGGTPTQFKAAFRAQRTMDLQQQALYRVELGETSIQEVLRALRTEKK